MTWLKNQDKIANRDWSTKFSGRNLTRLNPNSPQGALTLFQSALSAKRASDLVALTNDHPKMTLLSEDMKHWGELDGLEIRVELLAP